MDQKLKNKLDAHRFRTAVAKGLNLGQVLQVVFGGRKLLQENLQPEGEARQATNRAQGRSVLRFEGQEGERQGQE
jgi:hypothetical protein